MLLRVAGVLLAAVAAFVILSALRPSSASAAANPGEDDASLLSLTEAVTAPVLEAAAPVVEPVVAAAAPVVQPVVAAVAPVVQPVVAAVAPVVQPVVAAAAPVVQPGVAAAAPVVEVVEPVVAAAAPVVELVEPVVAAAAPVIGAGVPLDERVATAVESAVKRVQIIVDRLVGTLERLDAFDTVVDAVDAVVGLVDRVASAVPEAPPLSEVVGNLPPGLDPDVELPSVPEPTVVTPSPPTRTIQPDEAARVPDVVTELPSIVSTPDAAIAADADFSRRAQPSGSSSESLSELKALERPRVGDAPRATSSLDLDLRVAEKIVGGPLTVPSPATTLPATQGPTPASSGSGGDPIARSHAVVPSSAPCVNWFSRGVTTDVSWTSALFVLSVECPG